MKKTMGWPTTMRLEHNNQEEDHEITSIGRQW
jgi:hypothetical protein